MSSTPARRLEKAAYASLRACHVRCRATVTSLAVVDSAGIPVRPARVTVAYANSQLPDVYLGHKRGVQELPLPEPAAAAKENSSDEVLVRVTAVCEDYLQVSKPLASVEAGRLRKATVVLRLADVTLRLRDARTGATVESAEDDDPSDRIGGGSHTAWWLKWTILILGDGLRRDAETTASSQAAQAALWGA